MDILILINTYKQVENGIILMEVPSSSCMVYDYNIGNAMKIGTQAGVR